MSVRKRLVSAVVVAGLVGAVGAWGAGGALAYGNGAVHQVEISARITPNLFGPGTGAGIWLWIELDGSQSGRDRRLARGIPRYHASKRAPPRAVRRRRTRAIPRSAPSGRGAFRIQWTSADWATRFGDRSFSAPQTRIRRSLREESGGGGI
jgi:hypothetical protein